MKAVDVRQSSQHDTTMMMVTADNVGYLFFSHVTDN